MRALKDARLYFNPKKCEFYLLELDLGGDDWLVLWPQDKFPGLPLLKLLYLSIEGFLPLTGMQSSKHFAQCWRASLEHGGIGKMLLSLGGEIRVPTVECLIMA
jgi:hypothetical protein